MTAGDSVCTLCPATGGCLASWHVAGQPVLRTADSTSDILDMASFPLVPYSNRIGGGSFEWQGIPITLAKNFAPEPHAIHGLGWMRTWAVERQLPDSVTLVLRHKGDEHWPWPFDAWQRISVGEQHLLLELRATNRAATAVPLAFGHHPYFDQAGAELCFDAEKIWMAGHDNLPTFSQQVSGAFDFRTAARVAGRSIDHCYSGLSGSAQIIWLDRPLALEIMSPLPAAVVYVPLGGDAFCFEPVPHVNNALNMPGADPGMPIVAPGSSFETSVMFRAVPK